MSGGGLAWLPTFTMLYFRFIDHFLPLRDPHFSGDIRRIEPEGRPGAPLGRLEHSVRPGCRPGDPKGLSRANSHRSNIQWIHLGGVVGSPPLGVGKLTADGIPHIALTARGETMGGA